MVFKHFLKPLYLNCKRLVDSWRSGLKISVASYYLFDDH